MERQQPSHFGAGFSVAEQFPLGRDLKARGEVGQTEGREDSGMGRQRDSKLIAAILGDRYHVPLSSPLSFAHAEGRNYRQLPDRARLREEPSPADIVCFKKYSFSELGVSGWAIFFWHRGYKAKGYFGFVMRVGRGMKWWRSGFVG
jgi:hypothetical protein